MKYKKSVSVLVLVIVIFSLIACIAGIFSDAGSGKFDFKAVTGETVKINGLGIYKNDSITVKAQGVASDIVTLFMGLPLLLISLYFARKGSFRGKLFLAGTLGYFLYTYMSYSFLWTYNPFFITYVIIMSASVFGFILSLMSFDISTVQSHFSEKLPIKFISGFQIFVGAALSLMWLGKIAPSITKGEVPVGLEHYTTLVIQAMDLGLIVPTALLSGILLIKRKPFGYLLSSVIILKAITMLTSITAMIINQALKGVSSSIIEISVFLTFDLLAIIVFILLFMNIKGVAKAK